MVDPISSSRPISPASEPTIAPKLPAPDLQNRISSFSELSTPQKTGLFVVLFALVASLILYLRRKFSSPLAKFPEDIQAWVRKNDAGSHFKDQQVACQCIVDMKANLARDSTCIYRYFINLDNANEKMGKADYKKFKDLLIRYVNETYPHILYPYASETPDQVRARLIKNLKSQSHADLVAPSVREIEQNADFQKDPFAYIRACRSNWDSQYNEVKSAIEHYFEPRFKLVR